MKSDKEIKEKIEDLRDSADLNYRQCLYERSNGYRRAAEELEWVLEDERT